MLSGELTLYFKAIGERLIPWTLFYFCCKIYGFLEKVWHHLKCRLHKKWFSELHSLNSRKHVFLPSSSRLVMAPPQWPCWPPSSWSRWSPTWRKVCTRKSSSELSAQPHSWYELYHLGTFTLTSVRIVPFLGVKEPHRIDLHGHFQPFLCSTLQ